MQRFYFVLALVTMLATVILVGCGSDNNGDDSSPLENPNSIITPMPKNNGVTNSTPTTTATTTAPTHDDKSSMDIIGQWVDTVGSSYECTITIYRDNGTVMCNEEYRGGGQYTTEMIESIVAEEQHFEEKGGNSHGDYYVLNADGVLELYDTYGYIRTARAK